MLAAGASETSAGAAPQAAGSIMRAGLSDVTLCLCGKSALVSQLCQVVGSRRPTGSLQWPPNEPLLSKSTL